MSLRHITSAIRRFLRLNNRPPVRMSSDRCRLRLEQLEARENPASIMSIDGAFDGFENGNAPVVHMVRVGDLDTAFAVTIATSGTATAGTDYFVPVSVVFAPYQLDAYVQFPANNDALQEPDETITVTLQPGTGYDIGENGSATMLLYDDDTPSTITITGMANVQEDSSPGLFQVNRTGAMHQQITVMVMPMGGTAMSGMDYQSPMSVTFAPWETEQFIIVTSIDDTNVEGTETITYGVASSGTGFVAGTPSTATIDLIDNDVYVEPTVSVYGLDDAIEGGPNGLFRLVRTGDLTASFTVNYTLSGTATSGSDYSPPMFAMFMSNQKYLDISFFPVADGMTEEAEVVTLTVNADSNNGNDYELGDDFFASVNLFNAAPAAPPPAAGTGLFARYYNTPDLYDLKKAQIDAQVNWTTQWGLGAPPGTGVGADNFSVMWVGKVMPKVTGNHTFYTHADDGVRLWINGALVIDKWNDRSAKEHPSAPIHLVAGVMYDIRMEYFDRTLHALAELRWEAAGLNKELIPQAQLFPIALDLDVDANGSIRDAAFDGANDYMPGYAGNTRILSTGTSFNTTGTTDTYNGQWMKIVLDGVGTDNAAVKRVVFALPNVSSYDGYTSNKSATAISAADANADYSFYAAKNTANAGLPPEIEVTRTSNPGTLAGGPSGGKMEATSTWVNFYAKDYGGWGEVEARVYVADGAGDRLDYTLRLKVSRDTDLDGLADKWEIQTGKRWVAQYGYMPAGMSALEYFSPNDLNDHELHDPDGTAIGRPFVAHIEGGDGHTLREEYRGYVLDGGGLDSNGQNGHAGGHIRLDPARKEILLEVDRDATVKFLPGAGTTEDRLRAILNASAGVFSHSQRGAGIYMYYVFDEANLSLPVATLDTDDKLMTQLLASRDTSSSREFGNTVLSDDFIHVLIANDIGMVPTNQNLLGSRPRYGGAATTDRADELAQRGVVMAVTGLLLHQLNIVVDPTKFNELLSCTLAHEVTHLLIERRTPPFDTGEHTVDVNRNNQIDDEDKSCIMSNIMGRGRCEIASIRFSVDVQAEIRIAGSQAFVL